MKNSWLAEIGENKKGCPVYKQNGLCTERHNEKIRYNANARNKALNSGVKIEMLVGITPDII